MQMQKIKKKRKYAGKAQRGEKAKSVRDCLPVTQIEIQIQIDTNTNTNTKRDNFKCKCQYKFK